MKSERELRLLAEQHNIKTTERHWFDCREEGRMVTKFIDLPRSRHELAEDLKEVGAL